MATSETKLWQLFTLAYENYVKPTKQLCMDLANGRLTAKEARERISSIERNPRIDKFAAQYVLLGKVWCAKHMPALRMNPQIDNELRQWVKMADDFHDTWKKSGNRLDLNRMRAIATEFRGKFRKLQVQVLKADVEAASKLRYGHQSGADAISCLPLASTPLPATKDQPPGNVEVPLIESTEHGATVTWDGTRYTVTFGTAEAFDAMIDAKGHAVGISKYVRKAGDWLKRLRIDAPDLAAIVLRGSGNSGYRLTVFDLPSDRI